MNIKIIIVVVMPESLLHNADLKLIVESFKGDNICCEMKMV